MNWRTGAVRPRCYTQVLRGEAPGVYLAQPIGLGGKYGDNLGPTVRPFDCLGNAIPRGATNVRAFGPPLSSKYSPSLLGWARQTAGPLAGRRTEDVYNNEAVRPVVDLPESFNRHALYGRNQNGNRYVMPART